MLNVRGQGDHATIELTSKSVNALRILGYFFLAPAICNRLGKGDQRGRRHDDHPLRCGIFEERRIALNRGRVKIITGHKHDDEIGSNGQSVPISFAGKLLNMCAHLISMSREMAIPLCIIDCIDRIKISQNRGLHINDKVPSTG